MQPDACARNLPFKCSLCFHAIWWCPRGKQRQCPRYFRPSYRYKAIFFNSLQPEAGQEDLAVCVCRATAVETRTVSKLPQSKSAFYNGGPAGLRSQGSETTPTSLPRRPEKHATGPGRRHLAILERHLAIDDHERHAFRVTVGPLKRGRVADGGRIEHRNV